MRQKRNIQFIGKDCFDKAGRDLLVIGKDCFDKPWRKLTMNRKGLLRQAEGRFWIEFTL